MDKKTNEQKVIWFDKQTLKAIRKSAKASDTDAAKWIRQACREKLERDEQNRAALAAHAKMNGETK
jgi:hypothetical protein